MTRVAAYVPDLMDRSKVAAAAPDTAFVATPHALTDIDADVYVLDLNRAGALDVLPVLQGRVIGFASHVDRDTLAAANERAGVTAMKRSEFFARLGEIVGSA